MENLVRVDNITIANWQREADIIEAIPCLRTYRAPERKVGCSKCAQRRECASCRKQGYLAVKQCLQKLTPAQAKFLHSRLQANQLRFTMPNQRGVEVEVTIRLGRTAG